MDRKMVVQIVGNLEGLRKALAEGTSAITTTTASMQKMTTSRDGSKLEQRAHNIVAAINEIGGVTRLSDEEARRFLKTLDDWAQKAERVGKDLPPGINSTRDALRDMVPP